MKYEERKRRKVQPKDGKSSFSYEDKEVRFVVEGLNAETPERVRRALERYFTERYYER